MARFGAWVALAVLTLYLVFIGGGWQGIYTTTLRSITVGLAGVVFVAWAVVAWRRPEWRPRSALLPAILACLASLAISTALSKHPRFGIEYLGYAIVLAALYLLLVRIIASPWFKARMATLVVSLFVVISVTYIGLVIAHWIDWWGIVGRITVPPLRPRSESLTYGNPSAVMTIVVLLASSAAAAIGLTTTGRRVIFLLGALAAGAVIFLSGSRSGWFAVGIAALITGAVLVAEPRHRDTLRAAAAAVRRSRPRLATAGLVVLSAGVVAVALAPAILRRVTESGGELRVSYTVAALRMFSESPVGGVGPGMWVANRILETRAPDVDYYIPHAHDIYVQTLAELGVLGAIAGLLLIAALFRLIRGGIRDPDASRRAWALAATFALLYFGFHQVFDFYANMPAILFAAALPVAWLDATSERTPRQLAAPGPPILVVGAIVVAIAIGGLLWTEGPAALHSNAVVVANEGDWDDALEPARAAVEADPEWPPYQVTYGLALARAGDHAAAAEAFRQAVLTDDLPESWLNLAAEQAALGDHDSALQSIERAMRLGYQRTAVSGAAGDLALRIGGSATAIDAFAWAVAVTPSFAGDPWWQADQARAGIFDDVVHGALDRASAGARWEIAAMAGDDALAVSLASELDPGSQEVVRDVLDARAGDDGAYQAVLDRCDANPLDSLPLVWCARLAAFRGDQETATHYREWGFPIGVGYAGQAELRVSDELLVGRTIEAEVASFYGTYTYRRPTPWDLLGPTLLHFTVK